MTQLPGNIAAAAVIRRGGKYLITRRPLDSHLGGLWEFPGGKVEPGESPKEALKRELKEEIGVTASVGKLIHEKNYDYPGKSVHLLFYECEITEGEPQPLECPEVAWINPGEFGSYEFPPADAAIIKMLSLDDSP